MDFWDDLNFEWDKINRKEWKKVNRRHNKMRSLFKHPNRIVNDEEVTWGNGKPERYADGTTIKYIDCNFNGFRKFKRDWID